MVYELLLVFISFMLLFRNLAALGSLGDVAFHYTVVDERRDHVAKEYGEHHSLGIALVLHAHDDGHRSHYESVYPLACLCPGRCHGVCGHEDGAEAETAEDELLPPFY